MAFRVVRFEETPNPNAVKCILDRPISDGTRSFRSRADAGGDAMATALFEIEGVTSVLMNGEWMTVNKSADAAWRRVKSAVEKTLAQAP